MRTSTKKGSKKLTLTVYELPEIVTETLKDVTPGKKYSMTLKTKGTKLLTWKIDGDLPAGITFDAEKGKFSGTPKANTTAAVKITLSNSAGSVSQTYTLKVKGTEPITLTLTGELPEGLSFDSTEGAITGTPTEACTDRTIRVIASNAVDVVSKDFTLTIAASTANKSVHTVPNDEHISVIQKHSSRENTSHVENIAPENAGSDFDGEYVVVAELPEVSVDVSGMYDFSVELGENARSGEKLVWLANSSEPSEDDRIAEFSDDDGQEIDCVPENRMVNVSVWLNKGVNYRPALAVKR